MKKIFLLFSLLLCFSSCRAQQPFEDGEYEPPIFLTVTGVMARNSDGTASVVKNNEYQRVFLFDAKDDMVEGWEYVVRLKIAHKDDLHGRDLVRAILVGYGISPKQAQINAVKIHRLGEDL